MQDRYYLTTPIYYVNDKPHIGHAYTSIVSDILARYMSLSGKEVFFLTGTDEHGQKVEQSAQKKNMDPQNFVDDTSRHFKDMMVKCNISNNDFIRTSQARHKKTVEKIWNKLLANGDIYLGKYAGWYSVRDEAFYQESELTEDKKAPTGADVEWVEEPSYFFRLSKYQDQLLDLYNNNPNFIYPKSRLNEVMKFVECGLTDLSISRTSFNWGVKVPGDDKHVIYVWLDALVNYLSALDYAEDQKKYNEFWPANTHIVGKDILRFHAVYWPAFLMSAGIELPKNIIAHGWWTNEGEKISKSLGNTIDPFEIIDQYGLDTVRYFLIREIGFGNDGNFSVENLIQRNDSELANKIGNLSQRILSFVHKNCDGKIPEYHNIYDEDILQQAEKLPSIINRHIEKFELHKALEEILDLASMANIYVDEKAPWNLRKTDQSAMKYHLCVLLEVIRYIGILLQPFVPYSAEKILDQLGIQKGNRILSKLTRDYSINPGTDINKPEPIFQKLLQL